MRTASPARPVSARIAPWLGAAAILLAAAGCGYHFSQRTDAIPVELKTVAIPLWKNDTAEPGIETIFTNAMVKQFANQGWLDPVSVSKADTVLEGKIETVDVQPVSFSSVAIELEDRVSVVVSVTLRRRSDQSVLWSSSRVLGSEVYDSTPDFNVNLRNREQALRKVASDMAASVHDQIFQVY
jgi:outer membrane lipopolysaccharide assembly protein LptE/RlpB